MAGVKDGFEKQRKRMRNFKNRRPHRSFKLSTKVDSHRPLEIEGYFRFSKFVLRTMRQYWRFFVPLTAIAVVSCLIFAGLMSQDSYNNLRDAIEETAAQTGHEGFQSKLYRTGLMFLGSIGSGGLSSGSDPLRTTFLLLFFVILWLAVVWFLRNSLAGHKLSVRDALYNCGSPIVPMIGILLVMFLQLIPFGVYVIAYSAAVTTNFISGGVEAMMFAIVGFLVVVLTLYWIIGSFLSLVVVTLPGVYPLDALKVGGDLVVGRRVKIIFRILWHTLQVLSVWILVLFPIIALEGWLSDKWEIISSIPIIPFVILVLLIVSLLWTCSYVYLFYRRIISDKSKPV